MSKLDKALRTRGWTTKQELEWLYAQANDKELVIEFGCYCGRSSLVLSRADKLVCVDTWGLGGGKGAVLKALRHGICPWDEWNEALVLELEAQTVIPTRMDLYDDATRVVLREAHGFAADMVFIDAAHDYDSVVSDIKLAQSLLKPGGLLCGHDYDQVQVREAVHATVIGEIGRCGDIWFRR